MAKRGAAVRADDAALVAGDDPSRPDNIPPQADDQPGAIVDVINDREEIVEDVNKPARDEDARSDAEKAKERQQREDDEKLRQRADDSDPEPDDGEDSRRSRRRRRGPRESDEDLSRKMQRRINREQELRRASEEEVTNITAENRKLKEKLAKFQRAGGTEQIETSIKALKEKVKEITGKLEKAIEAGETKEQLALQIELGEVQAKILLAERDLESAKQRATTDPEDDADADARKAPEQPKIVKDWLRANAKWWNLPSADPLRKASIELDKQIRAEIKDGDLDFDEYSEDHMDELTERLIEEADRLQLDFVIRDFNGEEYTLDDEADEPAERERAADRGRNKGRDVRSNSRGSRSPQGGMGGRDGRRNAPTDLELARQGKVRLSEADYAQMRQYKLDPNDPAARKAFGKERIRTILTEARNNPRGGSR